MTTRGLLAAASLALAALAAQAQQSSADAIAQYRALLADGKYYVASKEIKVTLGGCGG